MDDKQRADLLDIAEYFEQNLHSMSAWAFRDERRRELATTIRGLLTARPEAGEFICPKCGVRHTCPPTDEERPF